MEKVFDGQPCQQSVNPTVWGEKNVIEAEMDPFQLGTVDAARADDPDGDRVAHLTDGTRIRLLLTDLPRIACLDCLSQSFL